MNLSYKITDDLKINVYNDICLQGIIEYPKFKSKDNCEIFMIQYLNYINILRDAFCVYCNISNKFEYRQNFPFSRKNKYNSLNNRGWNDFMFDYCVNNFQKIENFSYKIFNEIEESCELYYCKEEKRCYWIKKDIHELLGSCDAIIDNDSIYFYNIWLNRLHANNDVSLRYIFQDYFMKKYKKIYLSDVLDFYSYQQIKKLL